jgi:LacI family transcriptional regulator
VVSTSARVTSFDVARAAGVSQSTVSRALRNDPSIGPRTIQRVLEAAQALHYVPSSRARALSTGATNRVAMVIDLDNPLWSLLVGRLHDELARHGFELSLVTAHGERDVETQLADGSVDGVIVSASRLASTLPATLRGRGIPVVMLQRHSSDPDVDAAVADDDAGGAAAARMLLAAGHQRIGALFGPPDTSTGREREAGFRRVLAEAGVDLPDRWVRHGGFEMAYGSVAFDDLRAAGAPAALFCANDTIAIGAMNAAHAAGLRVPHDIALVGFDDIETASWPLIDLSTIRVPFDDMLRSAVSLLQERMGGYAGLGRRVVHSVVPVPRSTHERRAPEGQVPQGASSA